MKKKIFAMAFACLATMNLNAQIYAGGTGLPMPTRDLYDTGMMNMYLRAMAETAAQQEEYYYRYSDMALEAYKNKQWNYVVYYVNEALNTKYYTGELYYLRGYAFEQLGNLRAAKKDYKAGMKYNCPQAAQALEALKIRSKRK